MKKILAAFAILFLVGCQTVPEVVTDEYTGERYVKGEVMSIMNKALSHALARLYYQDGRYWMNINYSAYGWGFFETATVMGGQKLKLDRYNSEVHSRITNEYFRANVDRGLLDKAANGGVKIRLEGPKGSIETELPELPVQRFLETVDEFKG